MSPKAAYLVFSVLLVGGIVATQIDWDKAQRQLGTEDKAERTSTEAKIKAATETSDKEREQAEDLAADADEKLAELEGRGKSAAESDDEERTDGEETASDADAEEETGEKAEASTDDIGGPYEPGGYAAITAQLERELGYSPKVLEILLYHDYANFKVQDRTKPKNVDQYSWRDGEFSEPVPVRLIGSGALAPQLFALKSIGRNAPASLAKQAEKVKIEEPELSTMIIARGLPFTPMVRILVNVNGPRESKQLRANGRGRVYEII